MGAAIDADAIPATGADETKILHTRGSVQKFVDNVLTPLTTTLSKAGPQYKRAFRDFERQTGVQIGKSKQIIEPFIKKMSDLKKISKEDYETLQDALANVGVINKDNQEVLDALDSPQATEEVSTPDLKENDTFEIDTNMPIGSTAVETSTINGVKTERKTRGLTKEEFEGGMQPQEITAKINGINQQAQNAKKALSGILPDLKINVYASQKDFQEATGVQGDAASGVYQNGQIYINATIAKENTIAHEAFHAAFLAQAPTSKEAQNASLELINTIARSSKNERLVQYAKRFSAQYDPTLQNEEALAEMFGVLSANYATLDVNTKTRIKAWIAQVADMLGMSGLFTDATTDKDLIDAFNTLSSSVANGTVTPEGIRITRGSGTLGANGTEAQRRFQADYTDPDTGVTYSYFKNSSQYQKMVKKGFITNDRSFFDFDGVPMSIHVPDAMFAGEISLNGEQIVEGRGGLNATARFHDDNGFWLSTKSAAEGMARDLNAQLGMPENTDGKVRMMLTSTNTKKLLSSVDGARGATKLMSLMSRSLPEQYREQADKMFLDAIKEASMLKNNDGRGLKAGDILKDVTTAEEAASEVSKYLNETNQAFPDREAFVEFLFRSISDRVEVRKAMEKSGSYKDLDFRKAYLDALHSVAFKSSKMITQSDLYTMGKDKKLPQANLAIQMKDAVSYMMAEPLIRDYHIKSKDFGSVANGSAYAVIEIDGPVKAVEFLNEDGSQKHESYRFAIVSATNKKATTHLLKDRVRALSHYDLGGKTENEFLMTQAGFTQSDYGIKMIDKEKARKIDEAEVMEPMTGRGARLRFPEDQVRLQRYVKSTKSRAYNAVVDWKLNPNKGTDDQTNLAIRELKRPDNRDIVKMSQELLGLYDRGDGRVNVYRGTPVDGEIKVKSGWSLDPEIASVFQENAAEIDGEGEITKASIPIRDILYKDNPVYQPEGRGENFSEQELIFDTIKNLNVENVTTGSMRDDVFVYKIEDEGRIIDSYLSQPAQMLFEQEGMFDPSTSTNDFSRLQKRPNETHEQALNRMLEKHNMKNEFQSVRKLLNYLYTAGREAGMDVSYMEQYFPRLVTDLTGLQDSWKGQIYDNEIERELDIYAKKKFNGRDLDPLERQIFLENLARNKILRGRTGSIQPAGTKERTIPIIDSDRRKAYYASAEQALDTYVDSMISSINQMKLIGTARVEKGQRVRTGIIGKMMDADLQRGTLSREAVNIIQDAVEARFGMHGQQSGIIRGAKNAGYILVMGNIGSAITNLGDFYFSAVQNGLVNTIQAAVASKELTREDVIGMKNLVTIEAKDGGKSLQKAVDFVFKVSGITAIDGLAKDTNINAALRDMRKRVRGKPNSREYQKLMKEISTYQGRQAAQTIADIRNGVNSDLVLEVLYNRLSNVAPISLSEMPLKYSATPNGRILYSLKSYTIKQFDFIRQESFSKMGSKKTFAEGFTNLFRIAILAMAANGSADVLKAILFNREIDEEDLVWNNILRMFGITKYTTTKARKEGIGTAIVNTILPPQIGILNDFTKDIDKSIREGQFDLDELRSVKYLPFVGKLYYWREGKGVEVEKRLANLKD
jgi:hypothetical protein